MRVTERVSAAFGVAAIAVAVLAVGGALPWSQALVALLTAAALVPLLWSRRRAARLSPLMLALAIPVGLTLLQLLPLPDGVLEWLDGNGIGLRKDGAELVGTEPWNVITLDAPGSLRGLAFSLILVGVAWIALRWSMTERGRYQVLATVCALCGFTALLVGVHELFGLDALYGVYEPLQASPPVLGPLLNANHLGGLMAAGALLGVGLTLYRNQRGWLRATWVLASLAMLLVAFATLSRGATLALIAGGLTTGATLVAQRFGVTESRRRRRRFLTSSLPIAIVVVCGLVVVIYSSGGGVGRQLGDTSLSELSHAKSKYVAWQSATSLIEESPWVGVGRGAFEPAFTRLHPASTFQTSSHLENEYLQAVVDWGLPGALLFGLAGVWFVVVAIRKWREGPLSAGALGAVVVVLAQSTVDFGVELLGVAVPIVAVAATLSYTPWREAVGSGLSALRLLRVAMIGALIMSAIVLMSEHTTTVSEDHEELRRKERQKLTLDDLRGPLERHPLDYLAYGLAAEVMVRENDPRAIRVLNHSLRLHPTHAGLHRMAARLLHRSGHREQAALEYAAAIRGASNPLDIVREVLVALPDAALAANAIPTDQRIDVIVRALDKAERDDVAAIWLSRILELRPRDARACELLYSVSLRRGDLQAAEAAGRHCTEIAPSRQTKLALARVLFKKKAYKETIRQLHDVSKWTGRIDENAAAWLLLCDAHEQLEDWELAVVCLRRLDATGMVRDERRAEITNRLSRIEEARKKAAEIRGVQGT